jgi:uracil-DNA glycosylase family 4
MAAPMHPLEVLQNEVMSCTICPRLRTYCEQVAAVRRRAYRDWEYWGKPVPSFGDPNSRLLIIGLAPAAHGANRTGRMFTGDRSGDFLFRALHDTGFATQPDSRSRHDGLKLTDAFITATVRCAPPDNKPSREETAACRAYLERELDLLDRVRVVVALGKIAFDVYLSILKTRGVIASRAPFDFGHNRVHKLKPTLVASYHPSQQNTSTGKLTYEMLRLVFERARRIIEAS